eukprot:1036129-Prorocentrum_minimum.AAC.1
MHTHPARRRGFVPAVSPRRRGVPEIAARRGRGIPAAGLRCGLRHVPFGYLCFLRPEFRRIEASAGAGLVADYVRVMGACRASMFAGRFVD